MCNFIRNKFLALQKKILKSQMGYCGKNVDIQFTSVSKPQNLFLHDNTNIFEGFSFISRRGRFVMKEGSAAAVNLTVITDSHIREIGKVFKDKSNWGTDTGETFGDVIVEEDVWLGSRVCLLPNIIIGRGSNIGTGSVVRNNVPPYAIVAGNPAKVIGFVFTPEEIIDHEKAIFPVEKRLPLELLEKNYEKYFLKRIKEIKEFTRL